MQSSLKKVMVIGSGPIVIGQAAEFDYDYSTTAELILKGLGSTASSMDKRIETNIPGYSAELF